jgi:hypothetical protein
VTASIMMSQSRRASSSVVNDSRAEAASRVEGSSLPFSTRRPNDLRIPPRPFSRRGPPTSRATVVNPAVAAAWAMPLPMRPQPSTPTFLISVIS